MNHRVIAAAISRRRLLGAVAATGVVAGLPGAVKLARAQAVPPPAATPLANATPIPGLTFNAYGGTDADYQRAGVARDQVAPWEDGLRTAALIDDPRSFEWWYSDLLADDGTIVVFTIGSRADNGFSPAPSAETARPVVHLTITEPDGTGHDYFQPFAPTDLQAATNRCDVRLGGFTFAGDLKTYHLSGQANGLGLDLTVKRLVESYRPGTGLMYLSGKNGPTNDFLGWIVAVPFGHAEGAITIDGQARPIKGEAYHDHNWGSIPFADYVQRWWWGRGVAGQFATVAGSMHLRPEYSAGVTSSLLIDDVQSGQRLVNAFSADDLKVTESNPQPHPDPAHGDELPNTVRWDYARGTDRADLTFNVKKMILSRNYFPNPDATTRAALDNLGVNNVWYTRFDTGITIDLDVDGRTQSATGEATLETPQFGI